MATPCFLQVHGDYTLPARLQKLVGDLSCFFCREILQEVGQEFCGLFLDPQTKGRKMSEISGAFFVRDFVTQNNLACQLRSADVSPYHTLYTEPCQLVIPVFFHSVSLCLAREEARIFNLHISGGYRSCPNSYRINSKRIKICSCNFN